MIRALVITSILLWGTACGAKQSPDKQDESEAGVGRRPNLLVIYTDDQRYDAWSFGGSSMLQTPHLDRIASEGVWFPRAYAATSRCCPSRASFLTGKTSAQTGVYSNHPDFNLLDRHKSFVDALSGAGYRTGYIGKWHLTNPGAMPVRGFDRWVSYEGPGMHFDQVFNVDGEMQPSLGHQADVLVDYALEFLSEPSDQPFCLVVAFKNPHVPLTPAPRHLGSITPDQVILPGSMDDDAAQLPAFYASLRSSETSRHAIEDREEFRAEVARYYELVLAVDEGVGRLFAALEASEALENTALLFTTDNGQLLGEHGLQQKGVSYEPSIRVPLALRLPGKMHAGLVASGLALNLDLAPTLLDLASVAPLEPMAGRSLIPEIRGETSGRESFLYRAPGFGNGAVVENAIVERRLKYVRIDIGNVRQELLFDLEADPNERTSLVGDAQFLDELQRLRGVMDRQL